MQTAPEHNYRRLSCRFGKTVPWQHHSLLAQRYFIRITQGLVQMARGRASNVAVLPYLNDGNWQDMYDIKVFKLSLLQITNRDLLHSVVGLYDVSLSDMTPDVLYATVCERWARTIILMRDLKGETLLLTALSECSINPVCLVSLHSRVSADMLITWSGIIHLLNND